MPFDIVNKSYRHSPISLARFDPRYWTVNFPRPCNASVVSTGGNSMTVNCALYNTNDLVGLIWNSDDAIDHPMLSYETNNDYSGCVLTFTWTQTNLKLLDDFNGATLTIEGRDSLGSPKTWYVRLWNYRISGTNQSATIQLDFSNLNGGYFLPADADPVYPYDIDRMFISMVAAAYQESVATPLPAPVYGTAVVTNITSTGGKSLLNLFTLQQPAHGYKVATGYDDSYNITPERLLRNITSLGYTGTINHYVGMSHYYRMALVGSEWLATSAGGFLNPCCSAWHADFFARAKAAGFEIIISESFELLNENTPPAWKQYDWTGAPALTGWNPPSTLLSPCVPAAQTYLQGVALAFCALASAAALTVRFQIGEPWWWSDFRTFIPCFYDTATVALYLSETGLVAPIIKDMRGNMNTGQIAYLNWLGGKLGAATTNLKAAVRGTYGASIIYLLFYAPQVLQTITPELYRANRPAAWNYPAFDILQLEDYDFVIEGRVRDTNAAAETVTTTMGYAIDKQNYFSGFVLNAGDAAYLWNLIVPAAELARYGRKVPDVYFWASPQIMRDGLLVYPLGDPVTGTSTVRAWTFSRDGHDFYVLGLGQEGTLVYDATTQQWSEWQSADRSNWRVISGTDWYELTIGGDDSTGTLWAIDPDYPVDDNTATSTPIVSVVTGGLPIRGSSPVPCNAVFVSGGLSSAISQDVGGPISAGNSFDTSTPTVRLRFSDDQGQTWVDAGTRTAGKSVGYFNELTWRSLGQITAPGRVFELTDNGLLVRIDGMDME